MNLSYNGLLQLLRTNVVELKFVRRHPRNTSTRRMLATLNFSLLNSDLGKQIFHFSPPSRALPYNASSYNLLTVFDLFMQDWRSIPVDKTEIIKVLPSQPVEEFWTYFYEVLNKMSAAQKAAFMEQ